MTDSRPVPGIQERTSTNNGILGKNFSFFDLQSIGVLYPESVFSVSRGSESKAGVGYHPARIGLPDLVCMPRQRGVAANGTKSIQAGKPFSCPDALLFCG